MNSILHLTIKKKWFDLILSGKKIEEYREVKPYWISRLISQEQFKQFDEVHFRNGYQKDSPFMKIECKGIKKKHWQGKEVFAIQLGQIIETCTYIINDKGKESHATKNNKECIKEKSK